MKAAVIGAAGFAGGELLRLLFQHPAITDVVAVSRSQGGKPLAAVHPALGALGDVGQAPFSSLAPGEAARGADVVFLALEHGESSRLADEIFAAAPALVVDLAADFRLKSSELHERFYGPHPAAHHVPRFVYGLADIEGAALRGATAIAAPGCFATAAQLALYPLASQLGTGAVPSLFAITGSSGAGARPKPTTHHPARASNVFAYSVLGHRHEGEVLEQWRRWTGDARAHMRLMTHAGPFVRGIHLTMHATGEALDPSAWARAYAGRPFVRVLECPPELAHVVGTNDALVHAAATPDGRELQVTVAIDNLLKGAAGQAVQAMNLALGLPETAGLRLTGCYPC
ncbi:MAG TPA: N-acetyl-gamma-glutamyl-phosphate reductase [Gemmatimonadales bacterium]|nr:N-acetyl-gamma-glutamyl-phosphate reductase [Gemmatimonadales bacterium]